jgi:apolipoprotein D and lipocalin family protein
MTLLAGMVVLSSCATSPKGARVVDHFEKEKYLGKWYEIARFDFSFERNLNNTTAEYSLRPDGTINVKNKGFNYVTKKWQEANGKAKFRGDDTLAALEVSFFGPFYAAYNVIALDADYQYALVVGGNLKYLWILSRTTTIPDAIRTNYLMIAQSLGYDVTKLIWVEHNQ